MSNDCQHRRQLWLGTLVVVGAVASACGPTSPSTQEVVYPAMLGSWNGTLTIADETGATSNVCTHTLTITEQTGGAIRGTAVTAGSCRTTPGTVSGTVTADGPLALGDNVMDIGPSCTRLAGGGYTGTVAGASLSARTTETLRCGPQNYEFTRSVTLALGR